jgi:DNA-binding MarR family transcriptional regulator
LITRKEGEENYPQDFRVAHKYRATIQLLVHHRQQALNPQDYVSLGEFRYRIRRFLYFSEEAARQEGLEPQQHQMLLAIRVLAETSQPTIGLLAEHLLIRHHSAVGLIDRLEERGLVERVRGTTDRRQVRVRLTSAGEEKLGRLSVSHSEELRSSGPMLVEALRILLEQFSARPQADQSAVRKEEDVSGVKERDL